jgi:chromosome segregation ATPase
MDPGGWYSNKVDNLAAESWVLPDLAGPDPMVLEDVQNLLQRLSMDENDQQVVMMLTTGLRTFVSVVQNRLDALTAVVHANQVAAMPPTQQAIMMTDQIEALTQALQEEQSANDLLRNALGQEQALREELEQGLQDAAQDMAQQMAAAANQQNNIATANLMEQNGELQDEVAALQAQVEALQQQLGGVQFDIPN